MKEEGRLGVTGGINALFWTSNWLWAQEEVEQEENRRK